MCSYGFVLGSGNKFDSVHLHLRPATCCHSNEELLLLLSPGDDSDEVIKVKRSKLAIELLDYLRSVYEPSFKHLEDYAKFYIVSQPRILEVELAVVGYAE